MIETRYSNAGNLADDIVANIDKWVWDRSIIESDSDDARIKIDGNVIKLEGKAGGKVYVDDESIDWKLLDDEVKNIISDFSKNRNRLAELDNYKFYS